MYDLVIISNHPGVPPIDHLPCTYCELRDVSKAARDLTPCAL